MPYKKGWVLIDLLVVMVVIITLVFILYKGI